MRYLGTRDNDLGIDFVREDEILVRFIQPKVSTREIDQWPLGGGESRQSSKVSEEDRKRGFFFANVKLPCLDDGEQQDVFVLFEISCVDCVDKRIRRIFRDCLGHIVQGFLGTLEFQQCTLSFFLNVVWMDVGVWPVESVPVVVVCVGTLGGVWG